jgi:hypothetical protein
VTEGRGFTFSENSNTQTCWKGTIGHSSWKQTDMRDKLKKGSSTKDSGVMRFKFISPFIAFTFFKKANNAKLVG